MAKFAHYPNEYNTSKTELAVCERLGAIVCLLEEIRDRITPPNLDSVITRLTEQAKQQQERMDYLLSRLNARSSQWAEPTDDSKNR